MDFHALNVYNTARRLYRQLDQSTQKVAREVRITSIAEAKRWIESIMENIAFANEAFESKENRLQLIQQAIIILQRLEIRVRIFLDLGFIKKAGFDAIIDLEASALRQLQGWEKAQK